MSYKSIKILLLRVGMLWGTGGFFCAGLKATTLPTCRNGHSKKQINANEPGNSRLAQGRHFSYSKILLQDFKIGPGFSGPVKRSKQITNEIIILSSSFFVSLFSLFH